MLRIPRLILGAYVCHPTRGSEPTVGWNRAVEAARFGHVDVITRDEDNVHEVRKAVWAHGLVGTLQFHFLADTRFERALQALPGGRYAAYQLWNRRAYRLAREKHRRAPFDLAHQVNLCGYRQPGDLWRLGIPFVWGPIGGTQNTPTGYLASGGTRMAVVESLRTLLNRLELRLSRRVRRAAAATDVLLAANSTVQRDLERVLGCQTHRLLETGVRRIGQARRWADRASGPFRLLWAGEVISRKGIRLMLDAHRHLQANARAGGPEIELIVVGDGPDIGRVRQAPGVVSRGWVPRQELLALYREVDAFAFTSLRDTSGNVMLEALAEGLPVVYLDHQGAHDMGSAEAGVPIPVSTPQDSIDGIVRAVTSLATDPARYDRLSRGAIERARHFCWRANGDTVNQIYADLLDTPTLPTSVGDGTQRPPALAAPSHA